MYTLSEVLMFAFAAVGLVGCSLAGTHLGAALGHATERMDQALVEPASEG